ncbi:MAG TPA: hypothetical protein VFT29_08855 [Gemmatimonadaceae bacterium]|nr:hypothetical protein [Gemmatimonadaceae bacterium]
MSKISYALPQEEWQRLAVDGEARLPDGGGVRTSDEGISIWTYDTISLPPIALPALIAIANSALHPNSPRKITRRHVVALRRVGGNLALALQNQGLYSELADLADALEAYLPPDPL